MGSSARKMMRTVTRFMLVLGSLGVAAAAGPPSPEAGPAWLGVLIEDALDGGIQVVAVVPGGPAERAGLKGGDILVKVNGRGLVRLDDLQQVLAATSPGEALNLELLRTGTGMVRVVRAGARAEAPRVPRLSDPAVTVLPEPPRAAPPLGPPETVAAYGFSVIEVTPDLRLHYGAPAETGVLVTRVDPDRPAQRAGLLVGDILIRLGEVPLRRPVEVEHALAVRALRGQVVQAELIRAGTTERLTLGTPQSREHGAAASRRAPRAAGAMERALELELERLRRRMEQLERELERVREEP